MAQQMSDWTRNEVLFKGRMGKDPDMTYSNNAVAVTKFSIAVNQGKDKAALWLNVVCFKELAEQVNNKTHQGDLIEVSGRLAGHKYQDKYYYQVIASSVKLCERAKAKVASGFSQEDETDPLGELDDHPF